MRGKKRIASSQASFHLELLNVEKTRSNKAHTQMRMNKNKAAKMSISSTTYLKLVETCGLSSSRKTLRFSRDSRSINRFSMRMDWL